MTMYCWASRVIVLKMFSDIYIILYYIQENMKVSYDWKWNLVKRKKKIQTISFGRRWSADETGCVVCDGSICISTGGKRACVTDMASGDFRVFGLKCGGRVLMCSGTPGCHRHPSLSAAFRLAAEMKDWALIKQTGWVSDTHTRLYFYTYQDLHWHNTFPRP